MATLVVRRAVGRCDYLRFRVLDTLLGRLRGLLGTSSDADPVALVGCSSIHTFGMRYRIDVAFVGSSGLVLETVDAVPPGRVLSNRRAWITLERPHRRGAWLTRGESVRLERQEDDWKEGGSNDKGCCGQEAGALRLCDA